MLLVLAHLEFQQQKTHTHAHTTHTATTHTHTVTHTVVVFTKSELDENQAKKKKFQDKLIASFSLSPTFHLLGLIHSGASASNLKRKNRKTPEKKIMAQEAWLKAHTNESEMVQIERLS